MKTIAFSLLFLLAVTLVSALKEKSDVNVSSGDNETRDDHSGGNGSDLVVKPGDGNEEHTQATTSKPIYYTKHKGGNKPRPATNDNGKNGHSVAHSGIGSLSDHEKSQLDANYNSGSNRGDIRKRLQHHLREHRRRHESHGGNRRRIGHRQLGSPGVSSDLGNRKNQTSSDGNAKGELAQEDPEPTADAPISYDEVGFQP